MSPRRHLNAPAIAALLAASAALAACGDERTAEAETDTSEVEVTTTLPEGALSDQMLQQQADETAQAASASPPATLAIPATPGGPTPPPGAANVEPLPGTTAVSPEAAGTVAPD